MAESDKNYFTVLGLRQGATLPEIKRAFKELAFQHHPDRNPHNPWAEERFKEAVEAYSYLTGNLEALRALRAPSASAKVTADQAQDILKVLFDIDHPGAVRERPSLRREIPLTLEEAFQGTTKILSVDREELCSVCQGSGVEAGAKIFTCTYCFGSGVVGGSEDGTRRSDCPKCNGRGFLSSRGCLSCRARGYVLKTVKLKAVVLPRGNDGQVLVLKDEGHELFPGKRGDVQVVLQLQRHPWFSFDGKDIICETTVEMSEAALGGEVQVPTLAGKTSLHLPPGTQSGQVFRLKGLGLGGDQFIKIQVKTPVVRTEKERQLLLQMQGESETGGRGLWHKIKKWFW